MEVRNIPDFNDFMEQLLARTECSDLEYKSAAGGFPGSFWDTYSAFANTDGGTIVLGVCEKEHKFYLDSLKPELVEKYQKDFWNNVNNKSTISCNLMKSEDVLVEQYKGHTVMLFFVPRADREQRPVYRTTQPYNGTFKRNHEGDYKCTEKEVQRMFADANTSRPADSRILRNYTMDDLDNNSLDQYRRLFAIAKPNHPWLTEDNLGLLRKLGGYRKDRVTGEEGFTLAGLLMFGKTDSITDVECCPNFFPDYQEILSDTPNERWSNRIYPDGTWEANLFQFYKLVLPRLQAVLPKPFRLENNIRIDETPAHIAVREALINFCVHADYSENASLTAKLYKHKIVLSNPGTMLVSKMQYYTGGDSVCRNKALQTMFMMLGTAEKAGSGVDKILTGWHKANWRSPIINTKSQPDKVELTLKMESLLDDEVKKELVARYGESILHIEHEQLLVLNVAVTDDFVTNESLRFILNLHKFEIGVLLKQMCKKGLLIAEGRGRGTKYRATNVETSAPNVETSNTNIESSAPNVRTSNTNVETSAPNVGTSNTNVETSAPNVGTSTPNVGTSTSNVGTSTSNVGTSSTLCTQKKRMSAQDWINALRQIASDWVNLEDMATMLHRNKWYISNHILPSLLKEGIMERLFPGIPNHPKQKYRFKGNNKDE